MTIDQAKTLKEGQKVYYLGLEGLPEVVTILRVNYNNLGRIEVHLVDNCYVPEKELNDYLFLTFDECAKRCEDVFKSKLNKLKELEKLEK